MKGGRHPIPIAAVVSTLVLLMTACTLSKPSVSAPPPVRIVAPADGSTVLLGDTIAISAILDDDRGIAWAQLWVDNLPEGNIVVPTTTVTHLRQDFPWTPNAVRQYTIKVVALNHAGSQIETEPITLYVSGDASARQTSIAVQLATATRNPFAVATSGPTLTFTPVSPATLTPGIMTPVPCFDHAAYVADVTVPDGTQFTKGTAFSKVWRLRNTGTCTWDTRYQLVFVGGSQLNAPGAVAVPQVVGPGGTVDITVPMVAPDAMGTYRSQWQMRNPDCNNLFGSVVYALIEVRPGPDDPPVITRFEVLPNVISQGQSATIYWESIHSTIARLYPDGQSIGATGSLVVSPNATTSYRLVANNAAGTVERNITLVVQPRPAPPPAPPSPANLTITATRPDGFDFTWTDTSLDEQGFRLYNADTRQLLATFAPNITYGTVGGLACETPFRFFLVAFNEGGESWASNTVQATTSACEG